MQSGEKDVKASWTHDVILPTILQVCGVVKIACPNPEIVSGKTLAMFQTVRLSVRKVTTGNQNISSELGARPCTISDLKVH